MQFKMYQGARDGALSALGEALGDKPEKAGNNAISILARLNQSVATSRYGNARAALDEQKLADRAQILSPGMSDQLAAAAPAGTSGDMLSRLLVGGKGNLGPDYTNLLEGLRTNDFRTRALGAQQGGDVTGMNQLNTLAKEGTTDAPFRLNPTGEINQQTGDMQLNPGVAAATDALAAVRNAKAGQATAAAGNQSALAKLHGLVITPQGASVSEVSDPSTPLFTNPKTFAGGASGLDKPSTALSHEMMKELTVQKLDAKGNPVTDLTGKPLPDYEATNARADAFNSWYHDNQAQFANINRGLIHWRAKVEKAGKSTGLADPLKIR